MDRSRSTHSPRLNRDELAEVIVDNAQYLRELIESWKDTSDETNSRDQIEPIREVVRSQVEWVRQAADAGITYDMRCEWLGRHPETLHWTDLGLKTLAAKSDRLKLRPSDLVESWDYLQVESQRGQNVPIETLWHLAYMASFFTEGCRPKQLAVLRLSFGWKAELPAYSDAVLIYRDDSGISASVIAPLEFLDSLTAPTSSWLDGVIQFGEAFTRLSRRLIGASKSQTS